MLRTTLRGLVAATLLLAAVSATAQAQESPASRFGLKAGISLPMGDFGDGADMGFHLGGHFGLPLSGALSLRIDGDYGRYGGADGTGIDNVSMFGGVANLMYRMTTESQLKPYFFGGLGFYNTTMNFDDGTSGDSSDLAFNFGVGYDFTLGNSKLFTELRYLSIQGDGGSLDALPIVIGIRF